MYGKVFLPIGPKVVPFGGSYLEFYKVIPKRNYFGAYGYSFGSLCVMPLCLLCVTSVGCFGFRGQTWTYEYVVVCASCLHDRVLNPKCLFWAVSVFG